MQGRYCVADVALVHQRAALHHIGEAELRRQPGLRYEGAAPPGQDDTMHADIASKRTELTELCRCFRVERLEVFGSAAGGNFDPARSDVDLLVTFAPDVENDLAHFLDFKEAVEAVLGRRVDLVERAAVEASRNPIRRQRILSSAQPIHG